MNSLSVIGLGKLGAPMLAVFAGAGFDVIGVDVDESAVDAINGGQSPVDEPGVDELLAAHFGRYTAITDTRAAVLTTDATFVIVPTPSGPDGGFTLEYLEPVCREIGTALREKDGYHLVSIVSTVMPGQTDQLCEAIEQASGKTHGQGFGLCYSPEFIALGSVVRDLQHPDYVLIGATDSKGMYELNAIYRRVVGPGVPIVLTNRINAEITKIAQNAFITMKIVFANHLGTLCGAFRGANVDDVTRALGHDRRIGPHYLRAGTAYGGPCFPRDNKALSTAAERAGVEFPLATHVDFANTRSIELLAERVRSSGSGTVGILGLSYKPGTAVCEESASLHLAEYLLGMGRAVIVYDPLAMDEARKMLGDSVKYAESAAECIRQVNVIVVMHPEMQLTTSLLDGIVVIDPWRTWYNLACLYTPNDNCTYIPLGIGPQRAAQGLLSAGGGSC
jgi:UDPglucose 6-dehydrogenase